MREMSISRQRSTDLVTAYDHSLEQQIVGRGSSLVCRDEELWMQAEALLRDGDAQEAHCFGLDPLRVMEESLKAAVAGGAGRAKARGGLQGLAKAFEVVEQAALNLYLGPWREEYKVVKMYSGPFTHYIKPVLSMQQVEKLFGLLGYKPSASRHEQLRLQSPRVSPVSPDDLLRLSCAFFLARCECRLLATALGKHAGEAQWELSVVRERQRGSRLQVALDNTKKMLEVKQPPFDGELEMDLYTDEQVNGGRRGVVSDDSESPRSLTWATQSSASPPAVKTHSNGVTSLSSASASLPTRDDVRISVLNCQLTKTSPLEPDTTRGSSASGKQGRRPCEEKPDLHSRGLQVEEMGLCESEGEANHSCSCLQSPNTCLKRSGSTLHDSTCALFHPNYTESHHALPEGMEKLRAVSPQGGSLSMSGMRESPTLTSNSAAMSSLVLHDEPKSMTSPPRPNIYHDCCNLTQLDPQLLCVSCGVFHSASCRETDICQSRHDIKRLGVCSCGRYTSRNPLVLCRYCGNEYCRDCWYRNPVVCICGQTFDQSSSV